MLPSTMPECSYCGRANIELNEESACSGRGFTLPCAADESYYRFAGPILDELDRTKRVLDEATARATRLAELVTVAKASWRERALQEAKLFERILAVGEASEGIPAPPTSDDEQFAEALKASEDQPTRTIAFYVCSLGHTFEEATNSTAPTTCPVGPLGRKSLYLVPEKMLGIVTVCGRPVETLTDQLMEDLNDKDLNDD